MRFATYQSIEIIIAKSQNIATSIEKYQNIETSIAISIANFEKYCNTYCKTSKILQWLLQNFTLLQ